MGKIFIRGKAPAPTVEIRGGGKFDREINQGLTIQIRGSEIYLEGAKQWAPQNTQPTTLSGLASSVALPHDRVSPVSLIFFVWESYGVRET